MFHRLCYLDELLITQSKDISFLSSDGIILNFSPNDQSFVKLFDNLAKNSSFRRHLLWILGISVVYLFYKPIVICVDLEWYDHVIPRFITDNGYNCAFHDRL